MVWTVRPVAAPASFEFAFSLAASATGVNLSSNGAVEHLDTSFLRGFTAGGQELWTRRFAGANPGRLAADDSGLYFVDPSPGSL